MITIAAGESYVYTFVNYNKGAEGTDIWENWVVEGRRSDNNHCFDFRADGGFWTWKPDADEAVLTASYTGNISANVSTTATDWLTAYNGVTVTLTITRSADGNTMTVEHSATTNNSTTYAGTFTCTGFGTGAATFLITNEDSHQNITKVVYTYEGGGTIYSSKMTYISGSDDYLGTSYGEVTSATTGYNKISSGKVELANKGWGVNNIIYVQVDASDVPTSGATITSAHLNLNAKGEGRDHKIGVGYNTSTWSSDLTWNTADRSITTLGNTQTATKNTTAALDFDISSAVTVGEATTLLIYDTAAGGSPLTNVTGTISYTTATVYDVTFTETNNVSAIVTINGEDVTNGTKLGNGTYQFKATATGYLDYEGEFTVNGETKSVEFTMTAKTIYNYTADAVDANNANLKAGIVSGTCYANESTSFYLPTCVLADETLHFMAAESSYKSETVTSDNQVFSYAYTTSTVENVVFFTEGENINGASTSTPTGNQNLASEGKMGRGSNLTVTTLPAGQYTIYVHYINTNSGGHSLLIKAGDDEVMNETGITARPTKNASFILSEEKTLTLTAAGSSTSGVDYLYIVKTGEANETVVVSAAGYATYVSKNNLDFSNATTKAYKVKVATKGVATLTAVEKVPANTPVLLYAENGNGDGEAIPVVATADAVEDNDLVAGAGVTVATTDGDYTNMILNNVNNKVGFYFANNQMVAANRAYLHILTTLAPDASNARMQIVFDSETSGIKSVNNALNESGNYFNLSGQRISEPAKGLYIVNGKKVIIK